MLKESMLNPHRYEMLTETSRNLRDLFCKLRKVEDAWIQANGRPFVVTSGLRSIEDQERINPSAMHSKHLTGQAADIADSDGSMAKWILANLPLMRETGLWFEDFDHTHSWCHYQSAPPKSGRRIFIP